MHSYVGHTKLKLEIEAVWWIDFLFKYDPTIIQRISKIKSKS